MLIGLGGDLLFGALLAPDLHRGLEITARYFCLGLSFYLSGRLSLCGPPEYARRNIEAFLLVTWLLAMGLGLVALLFRPAVETGRLTLGSAHPIPFSVSIGSALIVSVYWLIQEAMGRRRPPRLGALGLSTGLIAFVFLASNTRGTVLAFVGTLVFASVGWFGRQPTLSTIRAMVGTLLVGALLVAIPAAAKPEFIGRLVTNMSLITSRSHGQSIADRMEGQSTAVELFEHNAVLGVGTGAFASYSPLPYPHNLTLEVAAENGLIGVSILLLLVVSLVLHGRAAVNGQMRSLDLLLLLLVVFHFIEAQFSFTLWMQKALFATMSLLDLNRPRTAALEIFAPSDDALTQHQHPSQGLEGR
ncbi:MAG TPA: O-antigen ligase family protein [Polyangia bacterium]|nr:O-antigen ligase family protein [Polyangia bacterium]